ncbi:OsmC family protein [Pullulanibacillus sp. KACC 23026]|uniref:OsmC family protein n=1 Tax=Pullulanibacillus sp. KACC 23026 TaxID=3028315 RepID=UPI0023B0053B|nr:OsmC family protein [Pullulanibacillus sp. KACC 23026]WEG12289.1 OsmC family protein [Pullulanibacillus sp. KACC 23026]
MELKFNGTAYEMETNFGELAISADDTKGFRPFQLMVASIAGCSGTVMKKIFTKKRLDINDITIKADVTRNPEKADRIEAIHMTFVVKSNDLTDNAMEKIIELTRKNCSMVQSVQDSIAITESFEIVKDEC